MKYVITGSIGNISKPVSTALIKAGHDVTVITSKEGNVAAIEALGAHAAVGSVEDTAFLTKTFEGADAVYTMVPQILPPPNGKNGLAALAKTTLMLSKQQV